MFVITENIVKRPVFLIIITYGMIKLNIQLSFVKIYLASNILQPQ